MKRGYGGSAAASSPKSSNKAIKKPKHDKIPDSSLNARVRLFGLRLKERKEPLVANVDAEFFFTDDTLCAQTSCLH